MNEIVSVYEGHGEKEDAGDRKQVVREGLMTKCPPSKGLKEKEKPCRFMGGKLLGRSNIPAKALRLGQRENRQGRHTWSESRDS